MRNFTLKAVLLGFAAITVGCIYPVRNTNIAMQSWVGHSEPEVIQAWGPANSISPDGAGGHILIYYFDKTRDPRHKANCHRNEDRTVCLMRNCRRSAPTLPEYASDIGYADGR